MAVDFIDAANGPLAFTINNDEQEFVKAWFVFSRKLAFLRQSQLWKSTNLRFVHILILFELEISKKMIEERQKFNITWKKKNHMQKVNWLTKTQFTSS